MKLNKAILIGAMGLLAVGVMPAQAEGDHAAAPMLSSGVDKSAAQVTRKRIVSSFRDAYEREGEPRIAIFWNRKFDDQLSQWQANWRKSRTGEVAEKSSEKFEPTGGSQAPYEKSSSGGTKIVSALHGETNAEKQEREGFSESTQFAFSSGYLNPFISTQVKVLDRDAIMRLVQRDQAKQAGAEIMADYQKVETDALVDYADYVAEILLAPNADANLGMRFMVSVKEVATGRVVAMFESEGDAPGARKSNWVATSEGFKKAKPNEAGAPFDIGEQLAYETMQALLNSW